MNEFIYVGARTGSGGIKAKNAKLSLLKLLACILCAALVMEVLVYFILIPCFAPVKITYSKTASYSTDELTSLLCSSTHPSWLMFNTTTACATLSNLPGIESAAVEKKFPGKIFVRISERVPVAVTLATYDDRTVAVMLDRTGAVFTPAALPENNSLPLITGLSVEDIGQGLRLSQKYHPLLEQLETLAALPKKYLASFSEIHVEPKKIGGYELIVYPIESRVRVLLDMALNEDCLKTVMVTLDVVSSMEPDVEEIDLRYGAFSYRVRETAAMGGN
jgi:cell division protein FtsQ